MYHASAQGVDERMINAHIIIKSQTLTRAGRVA